MSLYITPKQASTSPPSSSPFFRSYEKNIRTIASPSHLYWVKSINLSVSVSRF